MTAIAFTQFKKRLAEIVESVHDNDEPITVTRADGKDFVIVPKEQWDSVCETEYLLNSAENKKRLMSAGAQIEAEIERRKKQAA